MPPRTAPRSPPKSLIRLPPRIPGPKDTWRSYLGTLTARTRVVDWIAHYVKPMTRENVVATSAAIGELFPQRILPSVGRVFDVYHDKEFLKMLDDAVEEVDEDEQDEEVEGMSAETIDDLRKFIAHLTKDSDIARYIRDNIWLTHNNITTVLAMIKARHPHLVLPTVSDIIGLAPEKFVPHQPFERK